MRKIILADDDDSFRSMLCLTLKRLGENVREAANGLEALKLHHAVPADLLITDLIMPDKEGLETILEFRRRDSAIKIIAMSGGGRINAHDFLAIARRFGADRILPKPFSGDELMIAIEALLGRAADRGAPNNKCIALGKGCGAGATK